MTIETTLTRAVYEGNGVTRKFPLPFPLLSAEHLQVYVSAREVKDSERLAPLAAGYSVQDIDTAVPYVIFPENDELAALSQHEQLTLIRRLPLVQQTNLENGGNLQAETLETQFDVIAMQLQQLAYDMERAVKIPPYAQARSMDVADVLQAMEKICQRAEDAARRLEQKADADALIGGLRNLSATWVSPAVSAGSVMELPVHYVPGRNVLTFSVDGVQCYPGSSETPGEVYQYQEVEDVTSQYSRSVRVSFPIAEGTICHAHVVASNVVQLSESLLERSEAVAERLEYMIGLVDI